MARTTNFLIGSDSMKILIFLVMTSVLLLFTVGTAGAEAERDLRTEEANRALVVEFYEKFFVQHLVDDAAKVVVENYIQHNPYVPDGKEPFVSYFRDYFKKNPQSKAYVERSAAYGDLVWLHVRSESGGEGPDSAVVDIFRVKDGMIVEHWDVIQEVPDTAANKNTMF